MPRLPLLAVALWLVPSIAAAASPTSLDAPDDTSFTAIWTALTTERPPRPRTGEVEFVRSFTDRYGVPCREYRQQVLIGDDLVTASGTVCRGPDGSWLMMRE